MPELPLFPLRTVLFPQMPLPLQVFEARYRALLSDCLAKGGRFGVVAIRSGREVGGPAEPEGVGTVAVITKSVPLSGGRTSLLLVGAERFRILHLLQDAPYPRAEVAYLPDSEPDPTSFVLASEARAALGVYTSRLARLTGRAPSSAPAPTDPVLLSWLIASALLVELKHKQRLLELPGAGARLRQELAVLRREVRLLDLDLANRAQPAASYGRN
ncbi:MAG: LON peptidase substrate-binding domain-containing protein [Candidatus Dormibacteria bacterium]